MTFVQLLFEDVVVPVWAALVFPVITIVLFYFRTTSTGKERIRENLNETSSHPEFKQHGIADSPYKMLLCVNTSIGMGKGKIAAQCGHATLGAYKLSEKYNKSGLKWWENTGCAKIAVKLSEDEMDEIEKAAKAQGLISYVVRDAGRTQIAAGSRTVLAIGPAPAHELKFTSHLKLL